MEAYEDIKLLIAGRGEEEANLKKLVTKLKLTKSVRFLGFLPHQTLNKYIRESLCFLINTRKDLNMVSIPEAIVSGTPILTNTQPASAGYIQANKLGIARIKGNRRVKRNHRQQLLLCQKLHRLPGQPDKRPFCAIIDGHL